MWGGSEPMGKLRLGWAVSELPTEDSPGGKCWTREVEDSPREASGLAPRPPPPRQVLSSGFLPGVQEVGLLEDFSITGENNSNVFYSQSTLQGPYQAL